MFDTELEFLVLMIALAAGVATFIFLKPPKKGTGVESLINDPRWLGAVVLALVVIIAIFGIG